MEQKLAEKIKLWIETNIKEFLKERFRNKYGLRK